MKGLEGGKKKSWSHEVHESVLPREEMKNKKPGAINRFSDKKNE